MSTNNLKDSEAKKILLNIWPNRTTLWPTPRKKTYWLRAQPTGGKASSPRLKSPGAELFKTQPDGLYVYVEPDKKYVDAIAIEVSRTSQNLNDKRARYMPATHSVVMIFHKKWLLDEMGLPNGGKKPRWKAAGTFEREPDCNLELPVRYMRVLYVLKNDLYKDWSANHIPTGFEYFCRHSALSTYNSTPMQSFLKKLEIHSQFYGRN